MKKFLLVLGILAGLCCPSLAHAQYFPISGWCENGNVRAVTSGLNSTNPVQASYPGCTVSVIVHGGGAATIYSDATGTPLANPFVANASGRWQFFAAAGQYDTTLTGGTPTMPGPVVLSSLLAGSGSSGVTGITVGNLSPIFTTNVTNPTTTPGVTYTLSNAGANAVLANCTGAPAPPTYCTLSNAMLPAPGSDTQMIYNTSGLFGATTGLTWTAGSRSLEWINGTNNAFAWVQPGSISFNSAGGTVAPRISAVFGPFDFIAGAAQDVEIGQDGSPLHAVLPSSDVGRLTMGAAAANGSVYLNDGTSGAGTFQGPAVIAGTGIPETSITERIGSIFLRADGGAGTAAYLKEVGTGNTGWDAIVSLNGVQTLTQKTLLDTTTLFANTAQPSRQMALDLSGATVGTKATMTFAQTANRAYNFPDWTGTLCIMAVSQDCTNSGTFTALHFRSTTANLATQGVLELASTDTIQWRNNGNTNNDSLSHTSVPTNGLSYSHTDGTTATFLTGVVQSLVSTGTAPLIVASTTAVANLTASNHPIVDYCGATSGATQNCAGTQQTASIIIFGDVTLNTATSQSITTLPFTTATYSCSGSDLTTAAGVVSFNTYANASVTIAETGGTNTDHLRYSCVGK